MIIFKNTFENIKTINNNFPIEDQYYASNNEAIVADGITRDPLGIKDLSTISFTDMLKIYPRPSGAEIAAKEICKTFSKSKGNILERFIKCNEAIKKLNDKYILKCDYLENDYYGAVASCAIIDNQYLSYAFICDCGVIIYDKYGKIRFQTEDEKAKYSDRYINKIGIPWNLPEARKLIRSEYRNNPQKIIENNCVSYGALTGEGNALKFIRTGQIKLEDNDIILIYSDGFSNYLHLKEFIEIIMDFNADRFNKYIEEKSLTDYQKYGKEKTIIIMKKDN
jgi:serine/threonine protein phosphatase PrpC